MFVDKPDMTELRQGDVIRDIVFPIARVEKSQFLANATTVKNGKLFLEPIEDQSSKRPTFQAVVQASLCQCIVLSQCCDLQRGKMQPPLTFVLGKIVYLTEGMRQHYEILKANSDPYMDGTRAFMGLFWLGSKEEIGPLEYVADFSQAMSVS